MDQLTTILVAIILVLLVVIAVQWWGITHLFDRLRSLEETLQRVRGLVNTGPLGQQTAYGREVTGGGMDVVMIIVWIVAAIAIYGFLTG